jgi:hypothetical protein
MARDIVLTLLSAIQGEGVTVSGPLLREIGGAYAREAVRVLRCYADDARMNGLAYDADGEGSVVARFRDVLGLAGADFLAQGHSHAALPAWQPLFSDLPVLRQQLLQAVEADNS